MSEIFYEDIVAGEEVPLLHVGPLTSAHLMRWSAAIENWHKIHYDEKFAVEHDRLPGLLINGSLKQQFILRQLRLWAGDTGWIWKVNFQFRAMNVMGETLTVWARVQDKREADGFGVVELALGILNDTGKESTPGQAFVALPYRGGKALPYPFVPPSP